MYMLPLSYYSNGLYSVLDIQVYGFNAHKFYVIIFEFGSQSGATSRRRDWVGWVKMLQYKMTTTPLHELGYRVTYI